MVIHLGELPTESLGDLDAVGRQHGCVTIDEQRPNLFVGLLTGLVGVVVQRSQPRQLVERRALPPMGVEGRHRIDDALGLRHGATIDLIEGDGVGKIFEQEHEVAGVTGEVGVVAAGQAQAHVAMGDVAVEADLGPVEAVELGDGAGLVVGGAHLGDEARAVTKAHLGELAEDPDADADRFDVRVAANVASERVGEPGRRQIIEDARYRDPDHGAEQ